MRHVREGGLGIPGGLTGVLWAGVCSELAVTYGWSIRRSTRGAVRPLFLMNVLARCWTQSKAEARHTVDAGGGYTIGAWKSIFGNLSKDIAKEVKTTIQK